MRQISHEGIDIHWNCFGGISSAGLREFFQYRVDAEDLAPDRFQALLCGIITFKFYTKDFQIVVDDT